jgi:hypothetical protein
MRAAAFLSKALRHAPPKDHADTFVETSIIPTVAAAFETYPELDVAEVLKLCVPALSEELRREFRDVRDDPHQRDPHSVAVAHWAPSRQIKD